MDENGKSNSGVNETKKQMNEEKIVLNDRCVPLIVPCFLTFITYFESHRIKLTSRGFLQRKDLIALYERMPDPKPEVSKTVNQSNHPLLHLLYHLAGTLRIMQITGKGSALYAALENGRNEDYKKKSSEEQYLLLLKAFWTEADWGDLQRNEDFERIPNHIGLLFYHLDKFSDSKRIDLENQPKISYLLEDFDFYLYYFQFFGLWSFELDEKKRQSGKSRFYASSITLTPLFNDLDQSLAKMWDRVPLDDSYFMDIIFEENEAEGNQGWREEEDQEDRWEIEASAGQQFDNEIVSLFKEPINLDLYETTEGRVNKNTAAFLFKVAMSRSCWRTIQLPGSASLYDLHHWIQRAFDFDDDHLYAFFMDGKKFGRKGIYSPYDDQGPFADKIIINDLMLYEGQSFLYLFDYGDEWEFNITVEKIVEGESLPVGIEKSKGEAPDQYGADW
ncbi:MAG: plasmid pRiA4b ORF-3 family protein [Sporolactobacillus sp.]